jgi:hypothetical protein
MIVGFTDVKHGDTIYPVQSKAREGERLLQTRCSCAAAVLGKTPLPLPTKPKKRNSEMRKKEQQLREQSPPVPA